MLTDFQGGSVSDAQTQAAKPCYPRRMPLIPSDSPRDPPRPWKLPTAAWINPHGIRSTTEEVTHQISKKVSQSC